MATLKDFFTWRGKEESGVEDSIETLRATVQEQRERLDAREDEISESKIRYQGLTIDYASLNDEKERIQKDAEVYKREKEEYVRKLDKVIRDHDILTQEMDSIRAEMREMRRAFSEVNQKFDTVKDDTMATGDDLLNRIAMIEGHTLPASVMNTRHLLKQIGMGDQAINEFLLDKTGIKKLGAGEDDKQSPK